MNKGIAGLTNALFLIKILFKLYEMRSVQNVFSYRRIVLMCFLFVAEILQPCASPVADWYISTGSHNTNSSQNINVVIYIEEA